jgi:hypothetical protein
VKNAKSTLIAPRVEMANRSCAVDTLHDIDLAHKTDLICNTIDDDEWRKIRGLAVGVTKRA